MKSDTIVQNRRPGSPCQVEVLLSRK